VKPPIKNHLGEKLSLQVTEIRELPSLRTGEPFCVVKYRSGLSEGELIFHCSEQDLGDTTEDLVENAIRQMSVYGIPNISPTDTLSEIGRVLDNFCALGILRRNGPDYTVTDVVSERLGREIIEIGRDLHGDKWAYYAATRFTLSEYEPFSQEYYDAMMLYNHSVARNDFEFGFLASESRWKRLHEDSALKGEAADAANQERGRRSGSDKRRIMRLNSFMDQIETVYEGNPSIRKYEEMVLRTAFDIAVPKGTYGHGSYADYSTEIRSNAQYKTRFDRLFHKVT